MFPILGGCGLAATQFALVRGVMWLRYKIMSRNLIKCNSVDYRKGYIEVCGDIHDGCVNIEAWNIHPEIDISNMNLGDDSIPDTSVMANTEIELSLKNAEDLVQKLTQAIKVAHAKSSK